MECLSRIRILPSWIQDQKRYRIPDPDPQQKIEASGNKLMEIWSWMFFANPGSRIQGSKKHRFPDPQHWYQQNQVVKKKLFKEYHSLVRSWGRRTLVQPRAGWARWGSAPASSPTRPGDQAPPGPRFLPNILGGTFQQNMYPYPADGWGKKK